METISEFNGVYRFLSNFWVSDVEYEGKTYPTVEHAFQAAKTLNNDEREKIRVVKSPAEAKKMGRAVSLRADWEDVKLKIMTKLIEQKFSKEPLRTMLVATGNKKLIEGNWWGDREYGVYNGEGKNHLGKILMKTRTKIAKKLSNT